MNDHSEYEETLTCEACRKEFPLTAPYCVTADGCHLCEEHAYKLSDSISQHEEILGRDEWAPGELDYETREEMEAALADMKADLAANGDRKILWNLGVAA